MSAPTERTLYGTELSGHTHRVMLLLSLLNLEYHFVPTPAEARSSEAFLRLNPLGQIPVLVDGGTVIADSSAILVYLIKRYASGSSWLPEDPAGAANVQRWLSIAAGEVKYGPAAARLITLWKMPGDYDNAVEIAGRLLRFMESHLTSRDGGTGASVGAAGNGGAAARVGGAGNAGAAASSDARSADPGDRRYLVGDRPTLADLACYSYVAHAPEGGVSLQPFPAVRAWISRVEALPGFKAMPASARTV